MPQAWGGPAEGCSADHIRPFQILNRMSRVLVMPADSPKSHLGVTTGACPALRRSQHGSDQCPITDRFSTEQR
jgi:hypothetical protein